MKTPKAYPCPCCGNDDIYTGFMEAFVVGVRCGSEEPGCGLSLSMVFPYEYEQERLAIDLINGSETLRRWVDDPGATPGDLDSLAASDEDSWLEERDALLLYR